MILYQLEIDSLTRSCSCSHTQKSKHFLTHRKMSSGFRSLSMSACTREIIVQASQGKLAINKEDAASISRPSVVVLPPRCCCWHTVAFNAATLWANRAPEVCPGSQCSPVSSCPRKMLLSSRILHSDRGAGGAAQREEVCTVYRKPLFHPRDPEYQAWWGKPGIPARRSWRWENQSSSSAL